MSKPDRSDRGAQFTALPSTADEIRALLKKDDTKSAIDAFDGAVAIGDRGLASEALARVRTGPKTTDYVKKNVLPRMQREFVQKFGAEMTESLQALQEVSAFRLGKRFAQKAISKASGAASFDTVMRGGKSVRVKRDLGGAGGGQFVSQQRAMVQAASRMIRLRRQTARLESEFSQKGGFDKPLPSDPIQRAAEIRKRQLERLRKSAPKKNKKKRSRPEVVVPVAEPRPETATGSRRRPMRTTFAPSSVMRVESHGAGVPKKVIQDEEKVFSGARDALDKLDNIIEVPNPRGGEIPISLKLSGGKAAGVFRIKLNDDGTVNDHIIELSPFSAGDGGVTLWHEFGHVVDWEMLNTDPSDRPFSTLGIQDGGLLDRFWSAVNSTDEFERLKQVAALNIQYNGAMNAEYWLSTREVFARAFAQWVALRTGTFDQLLGHESASDFSVSGPGGFSITASSQWGASDFEPVAKALDELFKELGWMR